MTRLTITFGLAMAVATSARAQPEAPTAPGAFALGVSAGPATFARDGAARHGFGGTVGAEATIAPTWFVRTQFATAPRHRLTLGVAHSVAALGPRAFLSTEGGFATVARRSGVYGGGGLQAPFGDSRLVFTGDVRLYLTAIDFGVAFYAGVKLHIG